MTARKVLLRIVFGSLALAAGFGAAGMVVAGHDTLWRIVGTCAATAAGALLALWSSSLLEREEISPGALSLTLFVGEYLLTLGLIWEVFGRAEDQAGLTVLFLWLTGLPALVFVLIKEQSATRVAARVGLVACAVSFLLLMIGTRRRRCSSVSPASQWSWLTPTRWCASRWRRSSGGCSGRPWVPRSRRLPSSTWEASRARDSRRGSGGSPGRRPSSRAAAPSPSWCWRE